MTPDEPIGPTDSISIEHVLTDEDQAELDRARERAEHEKKDEDA